MSLKTEKRRLIKSILFPLLIVVIMVSVKLTEQILNMRFAFLGVLPLHTKGLIGIITAPFIHADWKHLISNAIPFLVLSSALIYFYPERKKRILVLSFLLPSLWLWFFARGEAFHIGASGVVYALASFHFFSGIIRRQKQLLAFSFIIIFLYGSMVWGIFPDFFPNKNISWEAHLLGGIAGLILAIYYRKIGPQKERSHWEEHDLEWKTRIKLLHGFDEEEYQKATSPKEENKNSSSPSVDKNTDLN